MVIAIAPGDRVVAVAAAERVVAEVAKYQVIASLAEDHVIALAPSRPVIAATGEDRVVADVAIDAVEVVAAENEVAAVVAAQMVGAGVAFHEVVARTARQGVAAGAARQRVGAQPSVIVIGPDAERSGVIACRAGFRDAAVSRQRTGGEADVGDIGDGRAGQSHRLVQPHREHEDVGADLDGGIGHALGRIGVHRQSVGSVIVHSRGLQKGGRAHCIATLEEDPVDRGPVGDHVQDIGRPERGGCCAVAGLEHEQIAARAALQLIHAAGAFEGVKLRVALEQVVAWRSCDVGHDAASELNSAAFQHGLGFGPVTQRSYRALTIWGQRVNFWNLIRCGIRLSAPRRRFLSSS